MKITFEVECCSHHRPKKSVRFGYKIGMAQPKQKETQMVEQDITNEQKIKFTLNPVTETGKPAQLEAGSLKWDVIAGGDNATNLAVSEDGMSAYVISNDTPGDIDVRVSADADLGEGVEEISDLIRVHVLGARARNLGLVKGEPEPK